MDARNVVVILTQPMDFHADLMVQTLQRNHPEVEIFRLHTESFPEQVGLEARVADGRLTGEVSWHSRTLDLRRVRSVWNRRPRKPQLDEKMPPKYQKWSASETEHALNGILHSLGAFFVNPPAANRTASYKLPQLVLAQDLGFQVSPTLVTNRPNAARSFVDQLGGTAVLKALSTPIVMDEVKEPRVLYTNIVTPDDLAGEKGDQIRHVPVQLQGLVEKVCDIRVTVIGTQVFPVAMRSESNELDIRNIFKTRPQHSVVQLPAEVEHRCLELVRRLGLVYGAIDLLLTPEGEYIFLEINPNGQFAWLEKETGVPLMAAMADLLVHGPERSELQP